MKVGIVGRTGAGKSSILQILFRLSDIDKEGTVLIDGVDIRKIGLHMLRKNIGYIPQSPFIISGTIRENLDPFNEFSDKEVIEYLAKVKLDQYVLKMKEGLMTQTTEGNAQFSTGQKQLICLARAMLLKTKIIVLDEATANVDLETDKFIQEVIKETYSENSSATVLVIAHRLATVIDSDRILVMAEGTKKEYNHPFKLLTNNDDDNEITNVEGEFAKMLMTFDDKDKADFFKITKDNYMRKNK